MRLKLAVAAGIAVSALIWILYVVRGGALGSLHAGPVTTGGYLLIQLAGFGYAGAVSMRGFGLRAATLTGGAAGLTYAVLNAVPRTLLRLLDPGFMHRLQYIAPPGGGSGRLLPDPFLSVLSSTVSGLALNLLLGALFGLIGARVMYREPDQPV